MDITNEQEKLSDPSSRPSQHHVTHLSSARIIPEMVITSAEGTSECEANVSECTVVLIPPSNDHSIETNVKDTSAEFTMSNSVSEEKSDVDFEDVSTVVKDVISKCTESVSHSVRQRPLRMEIDKNAQQQENVKSAAPPPPPPPPEISSITSTSSFSVTSPAVSSTVTTSPTAMQRPLVFEGAVSKTEPILKTSENTSLEQRTGKREELVSDKSNKRIQLISEIPVENIKLSEESTSPTKKEGLHGVKKFFDSILHHDTQQPVICSEEPESPKDLESPNTPKSGKSSIKKFFQSSKPDVTKIEQPPSVELQNEIKESTSVSKPSKKFFDDFKHDTAESKKPLKKNLNLDLSKGDIDGEKMLPSSVIESPKTSSSFAKDTKQNIKAFFDTFRHESIEQKQPEKLVQSTAEKSVSQPNIRIENEQNIQSCAPESPKEIKESSFIKDTKQNIKSFFDTFKHEGDDIKTKNAACKKSSSHPDFSEVSREDDLIESSEKVKHKESFAKSAKQNVKTFFDTFKHEQSTSNHEETQKKVDGNELVSSEKSDKLSEKDKKPTSPKKDTKQSVKTFFDSFKLGDLDAGQSKETSVKTTSEPDLHKKPDSEAVTTPKDKKYNMQSFFDNFKLGESNADLKGKEILSKKQILPESEHAKEAADGTISPIKESKNPVKKLFSFKQPKEPCESDTSVCLSSQIPKKSEKDKPAKIVKSVTLDLNPTYSNGAENVSASFSQMNGHEAEVKCEIKERAQSVPVDPHKSKNIFTLLEKKPEACASDLDFPAEQSAEHKGSRQSMKKFFESFKPEKTDTEKSTSQSQSKKKESVKEKNSAELLADNDESKTVEKPVKEKKNKSIKRSLSDKLNREEVVQNFKGFFDSLGHKSSSKKYVKDSEHIYDVVEVKHDINNTIPAINISSEVHASKSGMMAKCETQGEKKKLDSHHSKDTTKSGSDNINISGSKLEKKKENLNKEIISQKLPDSLKDVTSSCVVVEDSSVAVSEPSSPKSDKNVFNAIGENILALKEKMLHPKEKRKSGIIEDSVEVAAKTSKINEMSNEKPQETVMASVSDGQNKESISNVNAMLSENTCVQSKVLPNSQTSLPVAKDVITKKESTAHPNSLYDTCCIKLAFLLRDKALEVVSERTKSPPPKPPKPSAEAIAKAQAAAVAKRIEAQKLNKSFGENFPISYDGMRFVDDETESSCDYKDVENFDYITDYELINRYKIDSSKLDTFSVPSTCSGLTSYYTADSIMETISLSSDVSYNFKQISSPVKNEIKTSASSTKSDLCSKQPAIKKVPPPIPPKPIILQNISKVKEKPDNKGMSQSVSCLSLSPKLKNKISKDPAVTQKRPLLVADLKGTQFSSLQHPKKPQKPTRNFDTVLKNESLKKVPCVSSDNMPAAAKKISGKDLSLQYDLKIEKRTKSPPRPPPPNTVRKPEKPPKPERPPPPIKSLKNPVTEEMENIVKKEEENKGNDVIVMANKIKSDSKESDLTIQSDFKNADEDHSFEVPGSVSVNDSERSEIVGITYDDSKISNFKTLQDDLNNNYETENNITNNLNNNYTEISNCALSAKPKPPPRNRRIRSRTVEIVPIEKQEERLKRSSSLSEIDVQKRVTFLEAEKVKLDSKSLYTTVNKNGKKLNYEKTSQSSPDLVSGRPLPPPPPPPRRFRSLERKGKSKKTVDERGSEQATSVSGLVISLDCHKDVRPPARRRKNEKERFLSLHTDSKKDIIIASENIKRAESTPPKPERRLKSLPLTKYDVNANISSLSSLQDLNSSTQSIPNTDMTDSVSKSNPKHKKEPGSRERSHSSWYDENESLGDSWEEVDVFPSPGSSEDYKESPKVPLRRKSETKKKSRETSKFYVNMEEANAPPLDEETISLPGIDKGESPLPSMYKVGSSSFLVDKETSPLPLDCSEKSVQTSLETLSQGIVSHDDESEDTDELLNLAQTLQKELSTIISRHKSVNDNISDTPSPPLSAATSEKNLAEDFKDIKKISSVRSSTSEVWPLTSSDESDVERVGEDSSNINEVSIKRKQKKIFYIAQEIMTSEEAFVDALKLLNVDFKAAVDASNKQRNMTVIPDETLAQILNHLPQLQHLNENLLMELKDRIENWDKHEKIADIIVKMGPFLKLYSWYIHDFESNVSLMEECKKKYPAFAQTVKEFETSARCKKLALNHFMLKPIQRIPQYRLLLQEYLHQLTEDSKDYQDTLAALQIVSDVANHANDSMKQGDNAQKLISIQNSIVGHKEIVKPGRVFIKEGELMKLSRKGMQPRWFVLFNDLLLYLTPVQQGLYRVNHELPLTGMKVAIPIQQDYQNEFSIISVTRSFTLAARSQEERQEWIVALTKAIEENASKRSTFTNSRLHQKAQDKTSSEEEGAFVLGKKAPVWIPDARVTMCQLCTSEFTVTFRRHHCRACGKVICSICSSHRISLPYLGNRIARVCDECHARLGQGSSACTESGETDSDNQQIAVKSHLRTDNRHLKKNKRSLPSVLKEVCANDQGSTISGYLHKKTGKSWKRDWFVVKDKVLYEYKASEDIAALKSTPLLGYEIESFSEGLEGIDASLLFQLTHPGQAPIIFYADTVGSAERWVSALKTATVLE